MSAVRGLLRDLVERKLWPIAVLLLVAAIAVPVYLGRSSGDEVEPPLPGTAQHADTGKASKAAVSIEDPAADDKRPGSVRNPFKQPKVQGGTDTTPLLSTQGTIDRDAAHSFTVYR